MKIGIYNRYWNTCGGGENYTGSIAEALSHDHEVELISVEPVDWDKLQSRLRLNFSRCIMRHWPSESCNALSPLSSEYELFVNSTYCSTMMPRSERAALICYFPHSLLTSRSALKAAVKRWFGKSKVGNWKLANQLPGGEALCLISGIYGIEPDGRAWGKAEVVLAVSGSGASEVRIPLWPGSYAGIKEVHCNGRPLAWQVRANELYIETPVPRLGVEMVTLLSEPMGHALKGRADARELGLCLDLRKHRWGGTVLLIPGMKEVAPRKALAAYDKIISISRFTSEWIGRRWHLPSFELPPPIDTGLFTDGEIQTRGKIILSVGRFFAGGHNKKHDAMARAFIRMREGRRIPADWRLVFIGARHREHQDHLDYFDKLVALCTGHPIDILPDLPFDTLLTYYRRAPIYWHAAGWGERIARYPERFEHFGMTTCEAMACGCVPVVFDAAGQQEIVDSSEIGFRFSNYETLALHMERLTKADPSTLQAIGRRSQASIARYARSEFGEKVRQAFNGLAY